MIDKDFATLRARAALAGIQITRRDTNSFDVKRGDSQFWFNFTASYSAVDFQDEMQGKTVIAPKFSFHISGDRQATQKADLRRLAREVGIILQTEMPSSAVVQTWRGVPNER